LESVILPQTPQPCLLPSIFRSDEGVHNRLISYFYVDGKNVRHVAEKICIVKNVVNTVAHIDSREFTVAQQE